MSKSRCPKVEAKHQTDTYRAVYTVTFSEFIYVLHAFQKKSKKGSATPKSDIELIKRRLNAAHEDYKKRGAERGRAK
ncbi:MAG TPA: type II toxin-antitoxin system RelE/ParE family toxin [Pyrinomonadaceae bacterium]|nr:type II toxin-antitoxin system RelE/ParE family toxin [Pyrinomonadaceae bacterium]